MIDQAKQSSWMVRSEREWAMPVCVQPRAVASFQFVDVRTNRPLSQTDDVYRLRVGQDYQLRIGCASDGARPTSVTLLSGPLTPVAETEEPAACQNVLEKPKTPARNAEESDAPASGAGQCPVSCPAGPTLPTGRLNLEIRSQDNEVLQFLCRIPEPESRRWSNSWAASRFEPATVRIAYADGRTAYEHRIPIVAAPGRSWAVSSMVVLALLLLGLPAAINLIREYASVPPSLQGVISTCSREDLGFGIAAAVAVLGIGLLCQDRMRVRCQIRRFRNSQRMQVSTRRQLSQR